MKVTILGSGTCASQLQKIPNRYPPGFLVEWGLEKLLFDCSEGIRFRLEKVGIDYADIHHIAISHSHPDHFALVHFLQSVFCKGIWGGTKNSELNIYCPDEIEKNFNTYWNMHLPDLKDQRFPFPTVNIMPMSSEKKKVNIGNSILSARKVYHAFGKCDALAFRLETPEGIVVYSGDTGDCPGIRNIAKNADLFIAECSARVGDVDAPKNYGHLNPYTVGDIAKNAGVKKVVLFHYTGLDTDKAMIKECRRSGYQGEVKVGKDFQKMEVKN